MKKLFRTLMIVAIWGATTCIVSCKKDKDDSNNGLPAGEWVDLGLPSGILWAKCNLGATTPEGYGNYYAWGETQTKSKYTSETYKYDGYELDATHDAATVILGSGAFTPSRTTWKELIDNTSSELITVNGVKGLEFTAPNGNSLFLPAAGVWDGDSVRVDFINYWTSTPSSWDSEHAGIFTSPGGVNYDAYRWLGMPIRAVCWPEEY